MHHKVWFTPTVEDEIDCFERMLKILNKPFEGEETYEKVREIRDEAWNSNGDAILEGYKLARVPGVSLDTIEDKNNFKEHIEKCLEWAKKQRKIQEGM